MTNIQKAQEKIDKIIESMRELKVLLSNPGQIPLQLVPPEPTAANKIPKPSFSVSTAQPVVEAAFVAPVAAHDMDDFESLKIALASDKWPEAVNHHLICDPNSHDDKKNRGRGIIELMIEEELKGLKFLDYGCGEGHCASLSAEYGTEISIGYDPKTYDSWATFNAQNNLLFTNTLSDVQAHGPFDVIVLFDVIDHLTTEDPVTVLKKVASLLSPTGKIYMRTHPLVSRHGTHLYHDLNKAYVHLVFTPEELKQLVPHSIHQEPNIGVTAPLATYDKYITEAGLKTISTRNITEKVEPFFKIPKISARIMKNTKLSFFPEFQLGLQFIDYRLGKQ